MMQKPIFSTDKKKMKILSAMAIVVMLFVVASIAMWPGFMMKEVSNKSEKVEHVSKEGSTSYPVSTQGWELTSQQ